MSPRTRRFLWAALGIAVAGTFLRIPELFNALEYDEIWSYQYFAPLSVGKILTDLGLPNNHPLNTLWLKIMASRDSHFLLRLHSWIAGIGTVVAGGGLALYYFRSRRAALWCMGCLAVSAPLIVYSQQARGYSIQLFFMTLFALCIVAMQEKFRPKRLRFLPEAGAVLSGTGAVWSVSSSALFLFPLCLAALYGFWKRRERGEKVISEWIALGIFGVFALIWYGALWQVMKGAQSWAEPYAGLGNYVKSVTKLCHQLGLSLVLFVLFAFYRKNRPVAFAAVFPVLAAVWTGLAGARVYLALIPAFAMMLGYTASRFRKTGWILCAGFLAASIAVRPVWKTTDWYQLFDEAQKIPDSVLAVYTATAGYPLDRNHGDEAKKDFVRRLLHQGTSRKLLMIGSENLNGTDSRGCESVIMTPEGKNLDFAGLKSREAELLPLRSAPERGSYLLAVMPPVQEAQSGELSAYLSRLGECWKLNQWFTADVTLHGVKFLYGLFVIRAEHLDAWHDEFLKFPPQVLSLYLLKEAK